MATIACLGERGTFSRIAAEELSAPDDQFVGYSSFKDVLDSMTEGTSDSAVLPIENTIAGTVYDSLDLLRNYPLSITDEHYLPVEQSLLVLDDTVAIGDITEVRSHHMALRQCVDFLRENARPDIILTDDKSTAAAAERVRQIGNPATAAIAHVVAGEIFDLHVLRRAIQDNLNNYTRFLKIQPTGSTQPGPEANKCSIVVDIPHKKGSLKYIYDLLFDYGHNIMTTNTRPMPNHLWEYLFYIDFVSEDGPEQINSAVAALSEFCRTCTVLGIYENKSPMPWLAEGSSVTSTS